MKIFLLANNTVGLDVTRYLVERGEDIVGLCVPEPDKQKHTEEIIKVANLPKENVFYGKLRNSEELQKIADLKPDIGIAAFWVYILKQEFLNLFSKGCINFHPGLLPYNRGTNPDVWPFIDGSPGGVTIHYIDPGVDTGDIIAQRKVVIKDTDVAGTFYSETLREITELFKEIWPEIKAGKNPRIPQDHSMATLHQRKDVSTLDEIDPNKTYTGYELIQRLRARTHPTRTFAFMIDPMSKERVYISIDLSYLSEKPNLENSVFREIDLNKRYVAKQLLWLLAQYKLSQIIAFYIDKESHRKVWAQIQVYHSPERIH